MQVNLYADKCSTAISHHPVAKILKAQPANQRRIVVIAAIKDHRAFQLRLEDVEIGTATRAIRSR